VCMVNKFSLTSLPSCVYGQQVFLDKFTFLCVWSTSFSWQVYLLVCTVNKFFLKSLPSCVYGQQVFLDKFTFLCVWSTSFPWQVYLLVCTVNKFFLTSFFALVHRMLLNIYLTSRLPFVCRNHRSISSTLVKFSLTAVQQNKFSLSKSWHDYLWKTLGSFARKSAIHTSKYNTDNILVCMTFNFNIFQCFSNIRNHLSNFSYLVCISCKIFICWRFYLFLKTESSRCRIASGLCGPLELHEPTLKSCKIVVTSTKALL
jgi:hypothetical protein